MNTLDKHTEDLLNKSNPFAITTAAHLKTKATKNDPQARYLWKWTITKALSDLFLSPETGISNPVQSMARQV